MNLNHNILYITLNYIKDFDSLILPEFFNILEVSPDNLYKYIKSLDFDLVFFDDSIDIKDIKNIILKLKELELFRSTPIILFTDKVKANCKLLIDLSKDYLIDAFYSKHIDKNINFYLFSIINLKKKYEKKFLQVKQFSEFSKLYSIEQIRLSQEDKSRQAYKDVIYAVTNRKLVLIERTELKEYFKEMQILKEIDIKEFKDVALTRSLTQEYLKDYLEEDRLKDMVLCVSEAVTNALKHANGGKFYIGKTENSVRVWIEDYGTGIDFSSIARMTLMKGVSTKTSLGYGFTILLDFLDHLYLCTDNKGTTLILEMYFKNLQNQEFDIDKFLQEWEAI